MLTRPHLSVCKLLFEIFILMQLLSLSIYTLPDLLLKLQSVYNGSVFYSDVYILLRGLKSVVTENISSPT